jgi:cytochrome c biogenesis protein CcdA
VIDLLGEALTAVARRSAIAYPLVFAAGVSTSVGPCVAPRYVAVTALASASRRPTAIAGAFLGGVVGAYVVLGLALSAIGTLWSSSRFVYAALATALAVGGIATLVRDERRCEHPAVAKDHHASGGGAFLLGASSAFVVSPCCTPIVAAIAGFTTLGGRTVEGVALLAAFACGHAAPLLALGAFGRGLAGLVRHATLGAAPRVVGATLMLALAVYYGALA